MRVYLIFGGLDLNPSIRLGTIKVEVIVEGRCRIDMMTMKQNRVQA